jgi:RNA polymerase sigma factor (sigma-70 family)
MIDDAFIKRYDNLVTYCVRKYAQGPVDDYKQDIYLRLHEHNFHDKNIPAYIGTIVRNYFYDLFKRKKDYQKQILFATNSAEIHLLYKDVCNKLSQLDNSDCLILYAQGYKYREIAEIKHTSISNVKSIIRRLRKKVNGSPERK